MDDVVQLSHPREIQYTSLTSSEVTRDSLQFGLWGCGRSCRLSHDFLRTEGNVEALFCHFLTHSSTWSELSMFLRIQLSSQICHIFDCSPVPSMQEWPSICNNLSPWHPTNFSHTFDPTQHATRNYQHWCDVWENEFRDSQFQPSSPGNFSWIHLPTLPNWMLIHTPENRRHAVPGTNYHKTVCEYMGWCGSVGKTYLSRACRMRTLANALMLSSFHSLLHWVAKILNSWHLKALSHKLSSSVRACINATLMSTTSIPKSLQLAALANKVMKNVSGFLTNKSSMRHSALNWRTRSRDLTRSPRHSSTQQTMSWACFPGGNSSTNSNASKFNMFRNSSSRPAFNSPSGWIVHWVQCDLGWGRQMACHKEVCWHPQCTPPVNSHFLQWILAQILTSWVSAVKLDAPPGLITGSPIFLFFKLTSSSCTISSWFPDLSSLIASPLSTISCSILARHSSVCCPFPTQPGHPLVRPYLSKMFYRKCTLCARLPISNSSFRWIVGLCCVLLAVAFRTANTQIPELQIPTIIAENNKFFSQVFSARVFMNVKWIHVWWQFWQVKY